MHVQIGNFFRRENQFTSKIVCLSITMICMCSDLNSSFTPVTGTRHGEEQWHIMCEQWANVNCGVLKGAKFMLKVGTAHVVARLTLFQVLFPSSLNRRKTIFQSPMTGNPFLKIVSYFYWKILVYIFFKNIYLQCI